MINEQGAQQRVMTAAINLHDHQYPSNFTAAA